MNEAIKKKIIEKAIFLEKHGLNDIAWEKKDAEMLLKSILRDKIGILGGDVYNLTSEQLQPTYDNWSCEINQGETEEEYYLRSKLESLRYVENYPIQSGEKIVFAITFTENMK